MYEIIYYWVAGEEEGSKEEGTKGFQGQLYAPQD